MTISYIDWRDQYIPDKIILPGIVLLVSIKFLENSLGYNDLIAAVIIVIVFILPIALGMNFGGGDIRFGIFAVVFVGLEGLGYFVILSALLHLVVLYLTKKRSGGFAPAMSVAALVIYILGNSL